ncbi:hypothetical protein GCM10020370_57550 [Paenibacillus hodogayensis]
MTAESASGFTGWSASPAKPSPAADCGPSPHKKQPCREYYSNNNPDPMGEFEHARLSP